MIFIAYLFFSYFKVYNANQFHGQDGLGAYAYGYETPESAKIENRVRSGDIAGSYTYKSGDNDIKVYFFNLHIFFINNIKMKIFYGSTH